jgi:nucleoid DNA-binding protein
MEIKKKSFPNKEKEDSFFNELAIESNVSDLQPVKDMYYALLRVIMNRLKKNERIYLPQWGEFMVKIKKGGGFRHKETGQLIHFGDTKYVAFKPFYKLRHYFKKDNEIL